jgi:hypothetical protein
MHISIPIDTPLYPILPTERTSLTSIKVSMLVLGLLSFLSGVTLSAKVIKISDSLQVLGPCLMVIGWIFMAAVGQGIIIQKRLRSHQCGLALLQAIEQRHPIRVHDLLRRQIALSTQHWHEALLQAICYHQESVFEMIMEKPFRISPLFLAFLLYGAIEESNSRLARYIIQSDKELNFSLVAECFRSADEPAVLQRLEPVDQPLKPLLQSLLFDARAHPILEHLHEHKQWIRTFISTDILKALTGMASHQSMQRLDIPLVLAAFKDNTSLVSLILSKSDRLSSWARAFALHLAGYFGYKKVARKILDLGLGVEFNDYLLLGVYFGHQDEWVTQLLEDPHFVVSPSVREELACHMVQCRDYTHLKKVLLSGPVSTGFIQAVIHLADGPDRIQVQRFLELWAFTADEAEGAIQEAFPIFEDRLERHPLFYLTKLASSPFLTLPTHMKYIDKQGCSPATDLGGVSKFVISRLVEALIHKKALILSADGVLLASNPADVGCYYLAKLLSTLATINRNRTDKIVVKALFSHTFVALLRLQPVEKSQAILALIAKQLSHHNPLYIPICDQLASEVVLQEDCDAYESIEPFFYAASSFYKGLSGLLKESIDQLSHDQPFDSVQGQLVEPLKIVQAIRMLEPNADLRRKTEWIKRKILESDRAFAELFYYSLTGKRAFAEGEILDITLNHVRPGSFFIRTCFNRLEVPAMLLTQPVFIAALEAALEASDFNIS